MGLCHKNNICLSSLRLFLMIRRRNRSDLNALLQILTCQTKISFDFSQGKNRVVADPIVRFILEILISCDIVTCFSEVFIQKVEEYAEFSGVTYITVPEIQLPAGSHCKIRAWSFCLCLFV